VALGLGFASALVIVADMVVLGNWQHMAIMDIAFPLTALYMGPIALWAYFARGLRMSRKRMHMHAAGINEGARDSWWQVSLSDNHCGAGCALRRHRRRGDGCPPSSSRESGGSRRGLGDGDRPHGTRPSRPAPSRPA
jgi:hypothetical protein